MSFGRRLIIAMTLACCVQSALAQTQGEILLGRALFTDANLSLNRNQSCETCHSLNARGIFARTVLNNRKGWWKEPIPITATFIDPDNLIHGTVVSDGSDPTLFGTLNAPSAGYAAFSPPFHFDDEEGLYIGGQFWNGRASYLRDQAALPPLNPVEMAMPSEEAVIERLQERRRYVEAFIRVYGIDLTAVQTDGTDPSGVENSYRAMTLAIEAFERSQTFNRFTSKFDFVETGLTDYTAQEERGADLFDEVCAVCHEGTREDADGVLIQGLMTDFSYDNLGVPANVNIAGAPDLGLGGNPVVVDDGAFWSEMGKQKVMSLRNIAITPPYMHNGVFETLEQVVHFYNTRDVLGVCADNNDPTMGISCWPEPEIPDNVNRDELGDLGLSPEDEAAIVAYLKTFTDGYQIWGRDPVLKWWSRPAYHYLPEEIMPARPPVD